MPELSEGRKADRHAMMLSVARLADAYGLAATVYPETPGARCASVEVHGSHGLRVRVKFDGGTPASHADTYVLSWHGVEEGTRLNRARFGNVNSYHGHKATDVARGFEPLMDLLRVRFADIADESAFIAAP